MIFQDQKGTFWGDEKSKKGVKFSKKGDFSKACKEPIADSFDVNTGSLYRVPLPRENAVIWLQFHISSTYKSELSYENLIAVGIPNYTTSNSSPQTLDRNVKKSHWCCHSMWAHQYMHPYSVVKADFMDFTFDEPSLLNSKFVCKHINVRVTIFVLTNYSFRKK